MNNLWLTFILGVLAVFTKTVHGQDNEDMPSISQSPIPIVLEATEPITVTFKIQQSLTRSTQISNSTKADEASTSPSIPSSRNTEPFHDRTTDHRINEVPHTTESEFTTTPLPGTELNEYLEPNSTNNTNDEEISLLRDDRLTSNESTISFNETPLAENVTDGSIMESTMTKSTTGELSSTEGSELRSSTNSEIHQAEIPVQEAVPETVGSSPKLNFQTQIILVASTLGGVTLLLIFCILALSFIIIRLKEQVERQRYRPAEESNPYLTQKSQSHLDHRVGYDNTAFNDGREMVEKRPDSTVEMERMGYDVYNGNRRIRDDDLAYIDSQRDPEGFVDLCQEEQRPVSEEEARNPVISPIPRVFRGERRTASGKDPSGISGEHHGSRRPTTGTPRSRY